MKITAARIADANSRMARIAKDEALGDGNARLARMAEVWRPIASTAEANSIPPEASLQRDQLGDTFIGVNQEGGLIAWGAEQAMPGTDMKWRPLIIVGPGRQKPTLDV